MKRQEYLKKKVLINEVNSLQVLSTLQELSTLYGLSTLHVHCKVDEKVLCS